YFRDIEERIINDIVQNKNDFVLSTGGGAVLSKKTSALLTRHTKTIWLKTSLENIIKRDTKKDDHPMLAGSDRVKVLSQLYIKRLDLYSFADIIVDTDNKTAPKTADEILKLINSD
ncbi:MAG: hypothetical protein GYA50_03295, partial [Eubacteriaceae bacterium]|nr:hypothetical protein [Eubacteriaceae bacterium]